MKYSYICVRVCNGSVIKYVCVCVYKSSEMDNGCTATVAWFVITQLGAYNCPPSPPNLSFVHFPPFLLQTFPSFTSPPSSSSFLFDRFWVKLRGGGWWFSFLSSEHQNYILELFTSMFLRLLARAEFSWYTTNINSDTFSPWPLLMLLFF